MSHCICVTVLSSCVTVGGRVDGCRRQPCVVPACCQRATLMSVAVGPVSCRCHVGVPDARQPRVAVTSACRVVLAVTSAVFLASSTLRRCRRHSSGRCRWPAARCPTRSRAHPPCPCHRSPTCSPQVNTSSSSSWTLIRRPTCQ